MNFKGKEVDQVLEALKEDGGVLFASQLQKKYLPEWQLLKVEDIFKYLYDNYDYRFNFVTKSELQGYGLEYSSEHWDEDLKKGGFTEFWAHKEKFKVSLKELLGSTKAGMTTVNAALGLVDRFF